MKFSIVKSFRKNSDFIFFFSWSFELQSMLIAQDVSLLMSFHTRKDQLCEPIGETLTYDNHMSLSVAKPDKLESFASHKREKSVS